MPFYCFRCSACDEMAERLGSMSDPPGPFSCGCGGVFERDYRAERPAGHVFSAFTSVAMGCTAWEAKQAYRDRYGNWVRDRKDGSRKILAPAGTKFDRKTGNLLVENGRQMRDLRRKAKMEPNR